MGANYTPKAKRRKFTGFGGITQQRQPKVRGTYHSYQLGQNYHQRTPIDEIHLKGHWLINAGVEIDSPVKVRVMEGCLVLTSEP